MFIPAQPQAYELFHKGAQALSIVESNGIVVDVPYLLKAIKKVKKRVRRMQDELREDPIYHEWRKAFSDRLNLDSGQQLGVVLFDILKLPCSRRTSNNKPATDKDSLEVIALEIPFVRKLLRLRKYQKLQGTYLTGLLREVNEEDGLLHPFFNLHNVRTYRGSSANPNFQNLPIRDDEIAKIIRRAFISRPGYVLVEVDFSGVEVRVAACYNKDPALIEEIMNPERDMHRDMAGECYMLAPEDVTKLMRYCGKNKFVFPEFYGSYFAQLVGPLWESIETFKFEHNGVSLYEHLAENGVTEPGACLGKPVPGTFENHLKSVEKRFWDQRFSVYRDWKKKWYAKYLRTGGFTTLTGFRCEGVMKRNDVSNYPIQGSAFHCLLASLIELQRRMRKKKMGSLIVGQIHDSIVADIRIEELYDYLAMAVEVMTRWLPKKFKWINVPIEVEAEVCPVGGNWYQKKEVKL